MTPMILTHLLSGAATPALAQEAPEVRFTAIFHLDRSGEVVGMEGCEDGVCASVDLGAARVVRTRTGFRIEGEDGSTESAESWDSCQENWHELISECDAWEPPPGCECSHPYTWIGQA